MKLGLGGKVALVGGGSRGLGRATAARLAREGADVAIFARSRSTLETAAEEIGGGGARVVPIAERASYITCVNLRMDGGWCLSPTF